MVKNFNRSRPIPVTNRKRRERWNQMVREWRRERIHEFNEWFKGEFYPDD